MLESFHIAATGMHAQQTGVDVIANNLANVNTNGYKKSRVSFEDLMYRQSSSPAGRVGNPDLLNPIGMGSAVSDVAKVFSQGELKNTERALDVAIQGDGFLEVSLPDGTYAYTRMGALHLDDDGMLVNTDGYALSGMIQLPSDAEELVIGADGTVQVQLAGETKLSEIGRIQLANVLNASGMTPMGDNLFVPSHASGDVLYGDPGEEGFGVLAQGLLESSNVDMVEELTNLLLAQRGYEINSKVIQTADEMLGIVNNLRR